jgi:hypothetical protein
MFATDQAPQGRALGGRDLLGEWYESGDGDEQQPETGKEQPYSASLSPGRDYRLGLPDRDRSQERLDPRLTIGSHDHRRAEPAGQPQ